MDKHLMNPATGSVDTEENWLAEMPTWEGDQQAQFDSLVEVEQDRDGVWVEVERHGMTGKRNAAKPEGEAATSQVFARVTPREKSSYVKAAKGKTLSEWVRDALNAAAKP